MDLVEKTSLSAGSSSTPLSVQLPLPEAVFSLTEGTTDSTEQKSKKQKTLSSVSEAIGPPIAPLTGQIAAPERTLKEAIPAAGQIEISSFLPHSTTSYQSSKTKRKL